MRRRRGLSVVEIMVSLVIVTTGLLITMAAISFGMKATTTSAQSTEATAYSRRLLEVVLAGGTRGPVLPGDYLNDSLYDGVERSLYGPDGPPEPFEVSDFTRVEDPRDLLRFRENAQAYNVSVKLSRVNPDLAAFDYALINVTVKLSWRDRLGPRSLQTSGLYRR